MKKIIEKFSVLLVLAACFAGCAKDGTTPGTTATDGKYLKKVNYWNVTANTETTIRELVLNTAGDITALRTYTSAAQNGSAGQLVWEFTTVEKNAAGKVSKISGMDKQQNKSIEYTFTYDAAGNLIKSLYRLDGSDNRTRNYTWDAGNRLTFENEIANNNSNKIVREKTYTYTGTAVNPSTLVDDYKDYAKTTYTLKFDDKKNPAQAAPFFLAALALVDVYKGNVIESSDGTTVTKTTLTYTDSGLASSSTNGSGSGLKFVYGD